MTNQDIFEAVMYVVHWTSTPRAAASRYHVPNKNILQVVTTLESIQEEQENPLVEYHNQ